MAALDSVASALFTVSWLCLPTLLICLLVFANTICRYTNRTFSWLLNAYLIRRWPIKSADGKRDIPTCPYVWPNGQGDVAKFLEGAANSDKWGRQHGRVYRIWSGMTPEIVLTHPADIRAVFADSDKHTKASTNNSGWLLGELLGRCVGLISGAEWQRVRTVTARSFSYKETAACIPRILKITERHFNHLKHNGSLEQGRLHPVQHLKFLPFWVVADILYGTLTWEMEKELTELTHLREALWIRMIQGGLTRFYWVRYLPMKVARDLNEFKRRWAIFNQTARDACRLAFERTPVVQMYEEVDKGCLDVEELLQTLDEMLFANLDVTIGAISWNLLFLASNLEIQEQLRQEILTNTKTGDKDMKQYLLNSTSFLAACVLESARLRPLAAFSVAQSSPKLQNIAGFAIPPRTNFIVDTYSLNVNNSAWGEDSEIYRPSRFLNHKTADLRYHYWRFGFGPRQCMGKYVADLIIRILLVHLVKNYRLSFHESTHWVKNPDTWITHPDTVVKCQAIGK